MTGEITTHPLVRSPGLNRRDLLRRAAAAGLSVPAIAAVVAPAARAAAWTPPATGAADRLAARLDAVLAAAVEAGVPGVALHVERGGDVVYAGAAGVAAIEQQTPLAAAHRFRLGSVAKAFTATVVLHLVEEGALSLDDTVAERLDDPVAGRIPHIDRVTLRQLLNHSSGIYDYRDDAGPFVQDAFLGPDADWAKVWTPQELLAYADGADQAPYFEPGQSMHYCNTGYILLGLIVEAATGRAFADELRDRVLVPLALKDTVLAEGAATPDGSVDCYHLLDGELLNVTAINLSSAWAAGAIVATPVDFSRFGRAVFAGELISPASVAEMFAYVPDPRFAGFGWGMGVRSEPSAHGDLVAIGGDGPGFAAGMVRLAAADLTVAVLINTAGGEVGTGDIRDEAIAAVLGPA